MIRRSSSVKRKPVPKDLLFDEKEVVDVLKREGEVNVTEVIDIKPMSGNIYDEEEEDDDSREAEEGDGDSWEVAEAGFLQTQICYRVELYQKVLD